MSQEQNSLTKMDVEQLKGFIKETLEEASKKQTYINGSI
jgi:hypothetical protein